MKRTVLLLIATLAYHFSNAQNTPWSTSGNIGIGTTTPSAPLNIFASGALTDLYPEQLTIGSSVPYNASPVASILFTNLFNSSGTNAGLAQIAVGKENSGNGDLASFMAFSTRTSGGNVADRVRITSTGNVGIGTTTPGAALDVATLLNPGTLGTVLARLPEGNSSGVGTYLGVKGYNTQLNGNITNLNNVVSFAIEHSFYGVTNSSINFLRGGGTSGGSISFNTNNNSEVMRLLYNGNVLIGRTTQQNSAYMLDVAGPAHATSIVVNSGGADFVFEPAYHLNSLPWLAKYINQNHHLPEIPSAKQMQAEGLNVGDNQVKLLQKVEELTLYLIEKDKETKRQNKVNEDQGKEIKNQKLINKQLSEQLKNLQQEMNVLKNEMKKFNSN